jgi:hypothetical protein
MVIDLPDDIELELVESSDDGAPRDRDGRGRTSSAAPSAPAGAPRPPIGSAIELSFDGELWHWRGPAPYHFISVPPDGVRAIQAVAAEITYGWGMIPGEVRIGQSEWKTALWPKDGGYVIPIKDRYRNAEGLVLGDQVAVELVIRR